MALIPVSHQSHDSTWSFFMPFQDDVICFACTLEVLQEEAMLLVRKQHALTELSSLLQLQNVIEKLESNAHIASHVLLVLLELMKNEDKEFSASVIDIFMKMLIKMDSEDLMIFILNVTSEECKSERNSHQKLLYLYIILGRLAQSSTIIVRHLQQEFEPLLGLLCSGMECPDEAVQSAIAFIMVYILHGPWETALSPVFLQNLGRGIICILNSAKSQGLILNALAVLKKLVESDNMVCNLLKMDLGKDSVMSVLKRLLVSKTEEFQVASVGILSCIINKREGEHCILLLQSDLLEFLFEVIQCRNVQTLQSVFRCLKPLCQREEFYTQCHSVYGIESVLRCFNILADMKNFDLMTDTFIILSTILKNQPNSSHLFINTGLVRNCLEVIGIGLKENHRGVFCSAIVAFQYVLKKEHLLCPVPFEILQSHLVTVSTKIWQQGFVNSLKNSAGKSRKMNVPEFSPVDSFLSVCLASFRLLEQCEGDPTACQSNYDSPSKGSNQCNSQCQFQENLFSVCSECAVPVALNSLEKGMTDNLLVILLKLIHNMKKTSESMSSDVIFKLISAGFLSKALESKPATGESESEVELEVNGFLQSVIEVLYQRERPAHTTMMVCQHLTEAIRNVKYSFSVLPQALSTLQLDLDVLYIYLFLLSHLCQLDECPLPIDQLFQVIKVAGKSLRDIPVNKVPDVIKRCLVFLWGYVASLENLNVDKSGGAFQLLVDIVSHDPPEKWYTHHPALVYWMYRDPYICSIAGIKVIKEWLGHLSEVLTTTDSSEWLETTDGQLMLEMFSEEKFSKIYLKVFAEVPPSVLETAFFMLDSFMESLTDDDDVTSFLLMMKEEVRENLNDTFLRNKEKEANMECQLLLLMKVYSNSQFMLDGMDIKIFYHVMKWITNNKDFQGSLLESCLKILSFTCRYTEVVPLLLQNRDIILALDHILNQGSVSSRSRAGDVVTQLMLYCNDHNAVQISSRIILDIQPTERHLYSQSVWESHSYLQLLNALLTCRFVSPVVTLKHCGRFPEDFTSPLITKDFRVLFVQLQQNVTQDTSLLREISFECLLSLLDYAGERCPKLARDLIDNPWNSLLLEVLCQTTEFNDSTAVLLAKFIDKVKSSESGHEIISESENLKFIVAKFEATVSSGISKEEELNM